MVIKALVFAGILDVSAPEVIEDANPLSFRRAVKSGEVFTIPDAWYPRIPNIKNAVAAGLLEIVSVDTPTTTGGDGSLMDVFTLMGG